MANDGFRAIPGYSGFLVSWDGQVIRPDGSSVSQHTTRRGYVRVNLVNDEGKWRVLGVHRAVALAWIENPDNHPQVNHLDGDKTRNCADNLEWASNEMNIRHAFAHGLHPRPETPVIGINHHTGETIWAKSQHSVSALGFNYKAVNTCLRNTRSWRHRGFHWYYESDVKGLTDTAGLAKPKKAARTDSALGMAGVRSRNGSFEARLRVGGKYLTVGRFGTPQEAHDAYLTAKRAAGAL